MLLDSQPPSKATGPSLLTLSCLSPSLTGLGVSSPIPQLLQEAFLGTSIPGLGLGRRPPGEARASARSQAGEKRGDRAELGVRVLRSRAGKGALQADGISPVCPCPPFLSLASEQSFANSDHRRWSTARPPAVGETQMGDMGPGEPLPTHQHRALC